MYAKKIALSLSIALSLVCASALAGIGELKRLQVDERAPFTGTLMDDEALRQIDAEMSDLRNCEKRLSEAPEGSSFETHLIYLGAGILIGGIVVGALK